MVIQDVGSQEMVDWTISLTKLYDIILLQFNILFLITNTDSS
jgi:hypothetical protein